ncbi:MAG: Chemotaxis protein CheW [Candidatus Heimdallarchaeota archaeon LC_3]|nr:MAG: Chemotaxis protein CheW [Candidatus Heimdallarchaeota archaeon LC_3]
MSFKSAPTFNLMSLFVRDEHIKSIFIFSMGDYFYGLPVEQVNQVLQFIKFNKVPGAPDYILGVIDVRGDIVTLIDLNKKLDTKSKINVLEERDIILVEYQGETVGMLVDRALALQRIPSGRIIYDLESITSNIDKKYLKGTAGLEDDIINLLNLDTILSDYEKIELSDGMESLEKVETIDLSEEELSKLDLSVEGLESLEKVETIDLSEEELINPDFSEEKKSKDKGKRRKKKEKKILEKVETTDLSDTELINLDISEEKKRKDKGKRKKKNENESQEKIETVDLSERELSKLDLSKEETDTDS